MKIPRVRTERWHKWDEGDAGKPIKSFFKKGFWKRYDRKRFIRRLLKYIIIFLMIPPVSAQKYDLKRGLLRGSTQIVPGIAFGLNETLSHRYSNFKTKFPNANDNFWNPDLSWRNKWKNGDPNQGEAYFGSSSFLVFSTDGYHLTNFIHHTTIVASTTYIIIGEKRPWWHYCLDLGIGFAFYGLGNTLTQQYFEF